MSGEINTDPFASLNLSTHFGTSSGAPISANSFEYGPVHTCDEGFRYFAPANAQLNSLQPERPLRVLWITSVRDVGGDDRVGSHVMVNGEQRFMQGALHGVLDACKGEAGKYFEIVKVIVDDNPDSKLDRRKMSPEGCQYSVTPLSGGTWIVPDDYVTADGRPIQDLVLHLPSSFRSLPLADGEARTSAKWDFEKAVARTAEELGADIILSDHCMVHFDHLHSRLMPGRVFNIHPAITWASDEGKFRGTHPTADAIQMARNLGHSIYTGASLHAVSAEFDAGQPILDAKRTEVTPTCTPEELRERNYQNAKIPVIVRGLMHLACNLEVLTQPIRAYEASIAPDYNLSSAQAPSVRREGRSY